MLTAPEAFARDTITREGDAGRAWIAELPRRIEALCMQWRLVVDGPVMHGYLGLVIPVRRGDEPCALKVAWIEDFSADEALALATWNGQGAARLIEVEPALGAMLLERLDHRRSLEDIDIVTAVVVAGRLLRRLAIPAPPGLRPMQDIAAEMRRTMPDRWERFGRSMPRRVLDRACDLAAQLGASASRLLVNYDLHYGNVLAGAREPWLVVDPKVVAGDPEFGVAQLLWRRLEDIQAQGGLDRHFLALSEAAELDVTLTRAWTFARCADYWLWGLSVGLTEDPARCAAVIRWLD